MADLSTPSGPLSAPSSTVWRRQRLLRIGSNDTVNVGASENTLSDVESPLSTSKSARSLVDESTNLRTEGTRSYGTVPSQKRRHANTFRVRRHPIPSAMDLNYGSSSSPASPMPYSHSALRELSYFRISERPISAYDAHLAEPRSADENNVDARTNGIRVWYSSFSSIDWLHDAIKDSVRFSRLRRRQKSLRSQIRLAADRSIGWIVVSIVGALTAFVAFLVLRSEQWLFDLKDGYCSQAWWKAKRFCCPPASPEEISSWSSTSACPAWKNWAEIIEFSDEGYSDAVEYVAYACVALFLAVLSCVLTINLTASTSFITRKESGVLSPEFVRDGSVNRGAASPVEPKRKVLYYAAGSGIPEIKTILSGFVIHGYLGTRTLFTKSVGLALSVASGLSLGKEGPFVHIASCIGNIVSRFFDKYENNEAKRREILSAACAAGVAVAFGAPIGGTLFSLEEVSYFFPPKVMWRSFFCAMVTAITLKFLDPFGTGKLVLFQVTYDKDWHAYELLFFLLLGVFGGVYGAYFSKLNIYWTRRVRNGTWLKSHPIAEVVLVTLITSIFCFLNPYTHMGGTELIYELFSECRTGSRNTHSGLCVIDPGSFEHAWPIVQAILVAMVVKGVLTIITFGIKVPAGIFIPSLGVGACAGRCLGIAMQWLQWKYPNSKVFASCGGDMDCVIPGLYAMVGAAATLSGVTRTTLSLAVIMFELTNTLTYVVPVTLAVLVAKTVADALEPKGIYDLVIELSQLPYLDIKAEYLWGNLQINDVTDKDVHVICLDRENTVKSLRDQLQALLLAGHDDSGFPILRRVENNGGLRMDGYIGANELEHALSIVADDAHSHVRFHPTYSHRDMMASSFSSLMDGADADPFDFSIYMDKAPLTIQSNSPLELLRQMFVKLGARYVVVTDTDGLYEGVIDKKTWLAFLRQLDEKS